MQPAVDFYDERFWQEMTRQNVKPLNGNLAEYTREPEATGCWKCENKMKRWYLNEYVIEISSPREQIWSVKVENLCSNCLGKLAKHILEFTHK